MSEPPASYYHDGRDILEAAYPACTSFLRYHPQPTLAGLRRRKRAVAMVLDLRSTSALERFRQVCYALEDSAPANELSFDIYDLAGLAELHPILSPFGEIAGTGEIFWISQGNVIHAMTTVHDPTRFDRLTADLLNA